MAFSNSSEVRRYIGGIFESAFADDELRAKLSETGIVLRSTFTDPDVDLVVDMGAGAVLPEGASAVPNAVMTMAAEVGNAYWQGKVNLPMAMAKGKIKVDGNVATLLKLAPLSKQLFPVYIETLKADGRTDLLA
ncbi:SCP2 sterol-binding domain-containing protein [Nocardia shimofusensis]|uniref:SCP2 sterol-binding domain-containing protein n=1 Tax=Nocardia shimofusensis TaxID=228596 RepID=UPI0008342218|nr:SCP2 sterol-binding domain-containing protein [Nocardia shimofusensis]